MSRKQFFSACAIAIAVVVPPAWAQIFEVISLEGSVKAQRVQKKEWEKLSVGSQLHDNDIAETFFQTKCVLRFGKGNVVIIGSNSKVLLNIRERQTDTGSVISDVNLTLFSGACFVKAIAQAHIGVYTSNAVGETENGSFSTVVESRTGETGFQVLGGKVRTRNIAQKEGVDCASGQTTMIFPGKEPTAPLYITYKHVSVLKHFFGDEYIQSELDVAGIKPTEDRTSRSSSLLSDAMMGGQSRNSQDLSSYKIPFSLNRIYGAILSDRMKNRYSFYPMNPSRVSPSKGFHLDLLSAFASAGGNTYPLLALVPSYSSGTFGIGLRLPFATNYTGALSLYGFSSFAGIMDKIDHLTWQSQSGRFAIEMGPQTDLTIGTGNVVRSFRNWNPYAVFQPLGLLAEVAFSDIEAQVFAADVSSFSLGGVHVVYAPSSYRFGAGYFFDANQLQRVSPNENNRFRLPPASSLSPADSISSDVAAYALDFGWDVLATDELQMTIQADFAQKLTAAGNDGFVFNVPCATVDWNRLRISAGFVTESGRFVSGEFNSFYMANRWKTLPTSTGDTALITQNSILSKKRICQGLLLGFGMNPYKGTAVELSVRQNLVENHSFSIDTVEASPGTDIALSLRADETLFKPLRYAQAYIRQEHMGLFPPHSSLFSSWEFSAGLAAATHPLYFGISLQGSFFFQFLDLNFNNKIDPGDGMTVFTIGLSRGLP